MKYASFLIAFSSFILVSCGEASSSIGIESVAKDNLNKTINTYLETEDIVQIEKIETSFSNDSLCIFSFEIKNDNSPSSKYEYVHLSQGDNQYFVFNNLQNEKPIYFSEDALDSIKRDNTYAKLDYIQSLFQKSLKAIIAKGNKVGTKEKNFTLNSLSNLGLWDTINNKDEFGDDNGTKSLNYVGQGDYYDYGMYAGTFLFTFTISPSTPTLAFSIYEDSSSLVTEEGVFELKIKDITGKMHKFNLDSEKGYIATWSNYDIAKEILSIVSKEKPISMILYAKENTERTYKFIVNTYGYNIILEQ